MSYSIRIEKKDGKLELVQPNEYEMPHIPDGTFVISGHHEDGKYGDHVGDDIGVRLTLPNGDYLFGYGSVRAKKPQEG